MEVAFIVQRYGAEILGGSEYHCRLIAERLAPRHQVEVLTTRAQGYNTSEEEDPEGTHRSRGGRGAPPRRAACPPGPSAARSSATSTRSTATPSGFSPRSTRARTRCRGCGSR